MVLIGDGCSGDEINALFRIWIFLRRRHLKPIWYVDTECGLSLIKTSTTTKPAVFHFVRMLLIFYSNSCSEFFVVFLNSVALPFYLDLRFFFFFNSVQNQDGSIEEFCTASQHCSITDYRNKQKERLVWISYSLRTLKKHRRVPKVVLDYYFTFIGPLISWEIDLLLNLNHFTLSKKCKIEQDHRMS